MNQPHPSAIPSNKFPLKGEEIIYVEFLSVSRGQVGCCCCCFSFQRRLGTVKPRGFVVSGTRPPWPRCTRPPEPLLPLGSGCCRWSGTGDASAPGTAAGRDSACPAPRCRGGRAHLGTRRRGTRRTPGPGSHRFGAGTAPTPTSDRHVAGGRRRPVDGPGRSRAVARWYPSGGDTSPEVAGWRPGHVPTWQLLCRWFLCPPKPPPAGDRTPL